MDNLTHSLSGWILARAGAHRLGAWVTPTLIIAANLPDIDVFIVPGFLAHSFSISYYRESMRQNHHGFTHSLLGGALESVLLALVVWSLGWLMRRRWHDRPKLWAALVIPPLGVCTHLFFDWMNTYGIRPWLPFDSAWSYGDMAFIVDPWMWVILGSGLFLGSRPGLPMRLLWMFLAAAASAIVILASQQHFIPWTAVALWLPLLASLTALRALVFRYRPMETPARLGLLLWTLYAAGLFVCSRTAVHDALHYLAGKNECPLKPMIVSANPKPAVPWRFHVLAQTVSDGMIDVLNVDVLRREVRLETRINTNLRDPALASVCETGSYRAWISFARHPVCIHKERQLILGDMRYRLFNRADWTEAVIPLPAPALRE